MKSTQSLSLILTLIMLSLPLQTLLAYVGPGTGITSIGAIIAVIAAILLALFGFVWYPLKRLIKKVRSRRETSKVESPDA